MAPFLTQISIFFISQPTSWGKSKGILINPFSHLIAPNNLPVFNASVTPW